MNRITLALAANMAAQAYDTTAQLPDFDVTQHVHGNIQWFAARNGGDLWVVFRGTDEVADWADNLNVGKTVAGQGYVHKGFSDALDVVWWSVMDEIYAQEIRHLHCVGHSLGGRTGGHRRIPVPVQSSGQPCPSLDIRSTPLWRQAMG